MNKLYSLKKILNYRDFPETAFMNIAALFVFFANLLALFIFWTLKKYTLFNFSLVAAISLLLVIIFNEYKKNFFAKILFVFIISFNIIVFSYFLGPDSDLLWLSFSSGAVVLLMFPYNKIKQASLLVMFPLLSWLITEWMFSVGIYSQEYQSLSSVNELVHYIVCFSVLLTNMVLVAIFSKITFTKSQELKNKNEQLLLILEANRQTTVELQEAYDELVKSRDIQIEMSSQVSFAKLVDGIAHEIKNPLHLIRARTELFLEKDADFSKEDLYRFSQSILKTIDRLTALMNPMFKYAKKDIDLNLAYFNLEEVVDDLILLSQRKCQEDGIALIKTNSFNVEVFADKNYIYQALMNIIVNSIQFTPEGGQISLSIITGITFVNPHGREVSGVRIDIRDTGKGIPADMLEKVFKPYITSKQSTSNVGLGLSIVFRYITSNNGLVKVDSIESKGTTVSVFLPKSVS